MTSTLRYIPTSATQYQTIGELNLSIPKHEKAKNYRRQLSLNDALTTVTYTISRSSGYTFYEFQPASLGARAGASRVANTLFAVAGKYAFGEFTIDAQKDDPTVTFRLILDNGTEHYSLTLTRSRLTPK